MIPINKRQLEVEKAKLAAEERQLKQLKAIYGKASEDIANKIKVSNGKIDVLLKNFDNLDDKQKSILQSQIYQRDFQKSLQKQIDGFMKELESKQYSTVSEYLKGCYDTGYIGAMYDIAGQGIPLIMPIDQKKVTKAMVHDTKLSKKLYTKLGEDVNLLKKRIANNISRGIGTADSYANIARNIANGTNVGINKTMRIARTEGHRIQSAAAFDAQHEAKTAGADIVKQWDSTLDGRTRDTHRQLDGQIRELDEPFEVGGMTAMYPSDFGDPAEDINCRCALLQRARWALDKDELNTLQERAAYFGLDKTNSFNDFKDKYLKVTESVSAGVPKLTRVFTPAKTIAEAEEYAKHFVDTKYQSKYSGNISYKGMSLENANKMNQVLAEVYSSYDIPMLNNLKPMNFREAKWKTAVEDGIAAAYQWGNGGTLFMNQKIFASEKVTSAFVKKADDLLHTVLNNINTLLRKTGQRETQRIYLEALKKTGIQCFSQTAGIDFAEATFVHESGHLLDDKIFRKLFREKGFDISASMAKYAGNISGYAVSTNAEYIAESFTAFWYGKTDVIDPDLVKIFQGARTSAKSSTVNATTDDIISSVKAFAKASKDFRTIFLPKQEYAHVMSEIATNTTKEQRQKSVFEKAIGNYIYTVENNGFGNYRIIDKTLIDVGDLDEIW